MPVYNLEAVKYNMSIEDGMTAVQKQFIHTLENECSAGQLSAALGDLIREMPLCDDLNRFIFGNSQAALYLKRFKNAVSGENGQGNSQRHNIRVFLHDVATRAKFNSIDEYLDSQDKSYAVTYKLGLGTENTNYGAGELGNNIRNTLSTTRKRKALSQQHEDIISRRLWSKLVETAQAGGGVGEYNNKNYLVFTICAYSFHLC